VQNDQQAQVKDEGGDADRKEAESVPTAGREQLLAKPLRNCQATLLSVDGILLESCRPLRAGAAVAVAAGPGPP
jgi:hypothetical protein